MMETEPAFAPPLNKTAAHFLPQIKNDVAQVLSQSPFLQEAQAESHITLFHRSEIVTGARLGRGGFSNVYEVVALDLNQHISSRLTPQQRQTREYYLHAVATGEASLAVKHLQKRLLVSDPNQFVCAASDLVIEAAYMSVLDHPNILKVRGLPFAGIQAFDDGGHDGYFIILDRLQETLENRIHKWRQPLNDASLAEKGEHAVQIARAIAYLHERRICFRDIKPANIGFVVSFRGGVTATRSISYLV